MDPWLLSFTKVADQRTAIGSSVGYKALPFWSLLQTVCWAQGGTYTDSTKSNYREWLQAWAGSSVHI